MSDLHLNFAALPHEFPGDDDAREARHQLLATLLGAFADGELPAETASQIDAHLLGCARCRRELDVQIVLRERLAREPLPAATSALRNRIAGAIAQMPAPATVAPSAIESSLTPAKRSPMAPLTRRTVIVGGALALFFTAFVWVGLTIAERLRIGPVETAASVPLFADVLGDYRRVTAGDLPGRARDLAAVRAAVPFPVEPLHAPTLRLLAAWTTDLNGEPAAVLAYRWNDRLVVEYLVAEQVLFRHPAIRTAIAERGVVAARDGAQGVLAWAQAAGGAILVGDATPAQLAALRVEGDGR